MPVRDIVNVDEGVNVWLIDRAENSKVISFNEEALRVFSKLDLGNNFSLVEGV